MTASIVFLILGAVGGFFVGWLLQKSKLSGLQAQVQAKEEELDKEQQLRKAEQGQHALQVNEMTNRLTALQTENTVLRSERDVAHKENELLRQQIVKAESDSRKKMEEQLELVRQQMQNATQQMLKQRSGELAEENQTQMNALLNPLKQSISEMRQTMENSRDVHNRNTASLEKAIEEVMKRATEIGQEADKLAHALRNENKIQGNWGELILDDLLCGQGLKEGIHYDKQVLLRDAQGRALKNEESGKKMIPDTILHLSLIHI